jgi:hypothetical protein
MARGREPDYDDEEDDLPWLAEVEEERGATVVPQRRLIAGIAIFLGLLALIVGGLYALTSRTRETGSSAGLATNADDVPLIAADPGPYKVRPDDPGGMQVDGGGQTMYAAGEGQDPGGAIDPNAMPEDPMARPTTAAAGPVAGAPVDLLPPAAGASEQVVIPPAGQHAAPAKLAPVATAPAKVAAATPAPVKIAAAKIVPPQPVTVTALKPLPKPVAPVAVVKGAPPPAKAASGSAVLQLGAFSSSAKAEAAWKDYTGRFSYLSGLGKSIVKLDRDGTTLYRLRATGVADRATAADLCARMKVAGEACLVPE